MGCEIRLLFAAAARRFRRPVGETDKLLGFVLFAFGDEMKQLLVSLGPKDFCSIAIIVYKPSRKDARRIAVFGFKAVERSQSYAVAAIDMAKGFKDFGFELRVRAALLLGLRLRLWNGACSFTNSHRCLLIRQCWLGRVRCISTGRCPTGLFLFWFARHG